MMAEAKAYASEFYDAKSADFKTKEKIAETIADFCAGWRAAGNSRWIPVDKELPEKEEDNPSLSVNVIVTDGSSSFESYYNFNLKMWKWGVNVTHWMPMPTPPAPGKEE